MLSAFLQTGKATFVTHVECPLLGFRRALLTNEKYAEYDLPLEELADRTELSTYIIALADIPRYQNLQFNLAYGKDAAFSIVAGNILAIGPTFQLKIHRDEKDYEKMSDIIAIVVDPNASDNLWISTDDDCLLNLLIIVQTYI